LGAVDLTKNVRNILYSNVICGGTFFFLAKLQFQNFNKEKILVAKGGTESFRKKFPLLKKNSFN